MTSVSVIGAGAWGTALAQIYTLAGHQTTLWARGEDLAGQLARTRINETYLPGFSLDARLEITHNIEHALQADIVLNVIPAQHVRSILHLMQPHLRDGQPVIICAKGFEITSGLMLSDIAAEECPHSPCAILTGPTFAHDLMAGKPSAATLASSNSVTAENLTETLSNKILRLYTSTDMIGAQTAGALKNVMAIACGIADGLQLGESARAALVTRGLAEIARLTVALGGRRETIMGLCGVGDMMLTCGSPSSRNFSLGLQLGRGYPLADILASRRSVTEGVPTAKAALELAHSRNVDMPIVSIVHSCLYEGFDPREALIKLMERPVRAEHE